MQSVGRCWNNTSCCRCVCHLKTYLFRDCSALYQMRESIIVQPAEAMRYMVQSRANVNFSFLLFVLLLFLFAMDNRNSFRKIIMDESALGNLIRIYRLILLSFIIVVQYFAVYCV